MADIRIQRLAKLLAHYSLDLRKGDRVVIRTQPLGAPLVLELLREALRAGAHPEYFITLPGAAEIMFQEASDEQLRYIPASFRIMVEEYEAAITILAAENTKAMSGVNPERMAVQRQAMSDLSATQLKRTNPDDPHSPGSLRWNGVLLPTNASAQDAQMSLADFENFVYRAYFLDEEDPIASWQALGKQQERMVQWLKGKHTVHLRGQDTDLTFSIEGRAFINDDAHYNMPGGEFFTGPVENTANGFIRYSFPATFQGRSVEDVRLRFENGVVVEASAAQGQQFLDQMLSLDEGARRLGEFAFGNNTNVDRCIKNTLFDEKMGGTVHLALGASIPQTGGVNQSALHWDMVCDLRAGSEVRVDGELFARDGQFVI
ncbi:MAG TPA: aminopeptidase [Ktedonobacteraceae bacterium]|nr:aminopeptidase [Ktedonobacteraceae bacterium]